MTKLMKRIGPIHTFDDGETGPCLADFSAADGGKSRSIPVRVVDAGYLKMLGVGRLTSTEIDGDDLNGTIEWDADLDAKVGAGEPVARCHFSDSGKLTGVVIELGGLESGGDPEFVDDGEAEEDGAEFSDGGDSARSSSIHEVAAFALDPTPEVAADWVTYPDSLLFRSGDYPAKKFALSPDELRAAASAFSSPIPNELEHVNSQGIATILDGKLGHVADVRASADGSELRGTVVIPRWLDDVWGDGAKKVSCVWDRADKTLRKLGLVIQGHVPDAALMAAFGDSVFGDAGGAGDGPDDATDESGDPAAFATPRKREDRMTAGWQLIHDISAMIPGVCPGGLADEPDGDEPGESPAMMGDATKQLKHLKMTHDLATEHGAMCSGGKVTMSDEPTRSDAMAKVEKNEAAEAVETAAAVEKKAPTPAEPVKFSETEEYRDMKARLEAAERVVKDQGAALEIARKRQVAADAAAFAEGEIQAGRALPAEHDDYVADFSDAAELDHAAGGQVSFSDAAGATVTGTRVEKLKARAARRPAHSLFNPGLTGEEIPADARVLFNHKSTDVIAEARAQADAALATTPEGRAILKKRAR